MLARAGHGCSPGMSSCHCCVPSRVAFARDTSLLWHMSDSRESGSSARYLVCQGVSGGGSFENPSPKMGFDSPTAAG